MTTSTPARRATSAACSLVAMPPVPNPLTLPPATAASVASIVRTSRISCASGWVRGSAVYSPSRSVSMQQQVGFREDRDHRGQVVVVANFDLGGRDRVVLVDDRHDPVFEQRLHRIPGVEIALAVCDVGPGEQHLPDDQSVDLEQPFPDAHQPALPDRGQHLLRRRRSGAVPDGRACSRPAAIAPDVTTITSRPPACRAAHCRAISTMPARSSRGPPPVSTLVPSLTTILLCIAVPGMNSQLCGGSTLKGRAIVVQRRLADKRRHLGGCMDTALHYQVSCL